MKRDLMPMIAVASSLFGVVVAVSVVASQTQELDPVKLAPHIYEIVLENEHVRVLKVTARPGVDSPVHSHPDRVLVGLNQCNAKGNDGQRVTSEAGVVTWEQAVTHGGQPTTVVNECLFIEVELKQAASR